MTAEPPTTADLPVTGPEPIPVRPAGDPLGRLGELADWLTAVGTGTLGRVRLLLFAAGAPPDTTLAERLAGRCAVGLRVVDVGAAAGRMEREGALPATATRAAMAAGRQAVDEEVDAGADLLVLGDPEASDVAATIVIAALTGTEPLSAVGPPVGGDDADWMRAVVAVRDGLRRVRPDVGDPRALLARAASPELAALTGSLVQAAARRTPVVLDGVASAAAALLAHDLAPAAGGWWLAGQLGPRAAQQVALSRLGLRPVLQFGVAAPLGCGALLAVPLLRAAADLPAAPR